MIIRTSNPSHPVSFLAGVVAWLGLGLAPCLAAPVTVDVDTTVDNAALTACTAAPNDCSLRGAIGLANANPGNNYTINLAAATYTLGLAGAGEELNATGDLDITTTAPLVLIGQGATATIIDANYLDRVLQVHAGADVTLRSLRLTHGRTPDGVDAPSSPSDGGFGGGIHNTGTLRVEQSSILANATGKGGSCTNDCYGGEGGYGGGLYNNAGNVTLVNATVSGNTTGNGGACVNLDVVTSRSCGAGGYGGGISSYAGSLTLTDSTVSGNTTGSGGACAGNCDAGDGGDGGGLASADSTLALTRVSMRDNVTGPGANCTGDYCYSGTGGYGGGLLVSHYSAGSFTFADSIVSGNRTGIAGVCSGDGCYAYVGGYGAGLYHAASTNATVTNVTFSGNTTGSGGRAGGIYHIDAGTLNVIHCTITDNTANDGGGISAANGTIAIQNSIVAGNHGTAPASVDCLSGINFGVITSLGYNLVGTGTGCPSGGTGDLTSNAPGLLPLADNGGPTRTHALAATSPALEQIPQGTSGCGTTYDHDQRGYLRPGTKYDQVNKRCEMGAWEAQASDVTTQTPIPTLSPLGLALLSGVVGLLGLLARRRRT